MLAQAEEKITGLKNNTTAVSPALHRAICNLRSSKYWPVISLNASIDIHDLTTDRWTLADFR
jgi:hypothetical protein